MRGALFSAHTNPPLEREPAMSKKIFTNRQLLDDLARVGRLLNSTRLSTAQYDDHGRYSYLTLCRRFGSWTSALAQVGLHPSHWHGIPADLLLSDIRRVAAMLQNNRLRIAQYLQHGIYSRKIIDRHFERWHFAVVAAGLAPVYRQRQMPPRLHRTPRTINTRLRFEIFQRDNFKCTACGRSPATDPGVKLQADHKIPWSAGGETTRENLQTLCEMCNAGKSNVYATDAK